MRLLTCFLAVAVVALRAAAGQGDNAMVVRAPTAAASYLYTESFETTGYENSHTEDLGTPNEDDTTPTPYHGTHSLNLTTGCRITQNTPWTAPATSYVFLAVYVTTGGSSDYVLRGRNGTTDVFTIMWRTATGAIRFGHGATIADSSTTFTTGQWIYIWLEYTAGSGANGTLVGYVSASSTKPGSPEINITTGTATLGHDRFYYRLDEANMDINIDRILVDDVTIGSAP